MRKRRETTRRILEIGGIASGVVLIAFGVAAIVLGFDGRSTVQSSLSNEYVVGTPDMTPDGSPPALRRSGQPVSNGARNLRVTETALASGFTILAVAALHRRPTTN